MIEVTCLIYDSANRLVGVEDVEGVKRLPAIDLPDLEHMGLLGWHGEDLSSRLAERLGVQANLLDDVSLNDVDAALLENRAPGTQLAEGASLVGLTEIRPRSATEAQILSANERAPCTHDDIPPWQTLGWYNEACGWMTRELEDLGVGTVESIQQAKTASHAAILVANTLHGKFWLKADRGKSPTEGVILRQIARQFPKSVPEVVVLDVKRRQMITRDYGDFGRDRLQGAPGADWEACLAEFAELQLSMVGNTASRSVNSLPDYSIPTLKGHVRELVADRSFLQSVTSALCSPLSDDEISVVEERIGEIDQLVDELESNFSATSLDNRDFAPHHVLRVEGRSLFFDWGFTTLSHPFFSMVRFLEYVVSFGYAADPNILERLRDAYLEPWTGDCTFENLVTAYKTAQSLNPFYQSVCWYHERCLINKHHIPQRNLKGFAADRP